MVKAISVKKKIGDGLRYSYVPRLDGKDRQGDAAALPLFFSAR